MQELKALDNEEEKPFKNEPLIDSEQSSSKKKKMYIIIIISIILVLAIIITLLCVFLLKNPKNDKKEGDDEEGEEEETAEREEEKKEEEKGEEKGEEKEEEKEEEEEEEPPDDKKYENIKLEVYSDSDNKEILFLSEEFNISQVNLNYLEESQIMKVDGISYPLTKSMKLSKGNHIIELFLNETKNSCENMFKNCQDIKSIYFNYSYNCQDSMENMFSGCSSLLSVNFDKINASNVITMKKLFNN